MIKCDFCGKDIYKPPSAIMKHNYCSRECSSLSSIKAEKVDNDFSFIRKCPICNKEFRARPGGLKQGYQKYCSRECGYEALRRENQERREKEANVVCEVCNKRFRVKPFKLKTARFCSKECSDKGHGMDIAGENNVKWVGDNEIRRCLHCGTGFTVRPYSKQMFCTRSCVATWRYLQDAEKTKATKPEMLLSEILDNEDIKYEPQAQVGPFAVDFLIENEKIIIEALGDWWHCNPQMYSDSKYDKHRERHWKKERRRLGWFTKHGYRVFGIWESDLKKDTEKACQAAIDFIKNGKQPDE
ncbi:MAG: DUF559 domain-containing protein, partial [Candidatus Omnitrophota bacterium]